MEQGTDGTAAMAFGESMGIVSDWMKQVQTRDKGTWTVGSRQEIRFDTKDPAVAESVLCIFDVSDRCPQVGQVGSGVQRG